VHIRRIWLTNFRNYQAAEVSCSPEGLTVIKGSNGQGKTNLLEAIGYVASLRSFRGASTETLIKFDEDSAIVRAEACRNERELLIECELQNSGRNRTLVNKQPLKRTRELQDSLLSTVFAPDDLSLVKGGPSGRRDYLDQLLSDTDLRSRQNQRDLDRILRQRNTLLRQAHGRSTPEITATLDVWDAKFTEAGEQSGRERAAVVSELQPYVDEAYKALAGDNTRNNVGLTMSTEWRLEDGGKGLAESLVAARHGDIVRGVTTVGPHRDEVLISIAGLPSRTHASQGEQRTLALALRLAAHRYRADRSDSSPILLLDDVFSELDESRSIALLREVPVGQTFLTTAVDPPQGADPTAVIDVEGGHPS
jgi:DNA replication and repair protein RecF